MVEKKRRESCDYSLKWWMRNENRVREDFWEKKKKKKIIKTHLGTMNLVGFRTCLKISGSYLSTAC